MYILLGYEALKITPTRRTVQKGKEKEEEVIKFKVRGEWGL